MNKKIFNLVALIFCMLAVILVSDVLATKMYWTEVEHDIIKQANLDGSDIETLVDTGLSVPFGIAIDSVRRKIYWTDAETEKIQLASLDGSNVQDIVTELEAPIGIALDLVEGKMYWTDFTYQRIHRANLDGSNVEILLSTGLSEPHGIALDLSAGKMYWTDTGNRKIQRANLDGTMVEDLIIWLSYPRGIALDVAGGKMYWTNSGADKIQRADLDGTNMEDLVATGLSSPMGIALDITGGKMYWTDASANKIQRANLDGSNVEDIVTGLGNPYGIAIPQPITIDQLQIQPWESLISSGPLYGPFTPGCISYTLTNNGPNTINWSTDWTAEWVDVTPSGGVLANGDSTEVEVCINSSARHLEPGIYNDYVTFSNASSGREQALYVELTVVMCERVKLLPLDAVFGDNFGFSVSIDGDYAIIGAFGNNYSGSAYIFKYDEANWIQQDEIMALDGNDNDHFGYSVSIDGEYVIIGDNAYDNYSGSAYIFKRDGTSWSQQAKLTALDGDDNDWFGAEVSISGDYAIVGAFEDDDMGSNSGSAYIFKRDGENWSQQEKLLALDGAGSDYFGCSVSIDGDYSIVGAMFDDTGDARSGSAYIFKRDGTAWIQQAKLLLSDGQDIDSFGTNVSLDSDYAIVGAIRTDDNWRESGSAYIFKRDGVTWSQQAKLLASDGRSGDFFGSSVSIDGDYAIVGAGQSDGNSLNSGSAYVFKYDGTSWSQQAKLIASDGDIYDFFGQSVSIDGDYAIVGASGNDDYGTSSGSAYVFGKFHKGDLTDSYGVNFLDFAVLGDAWMSAAGDLNWDAGCDISEPEDEVIDGLDLEVFVNNWLEGI